MIYTKDCMNFFEESDISMSYLDLKWHYRFMKQAQEVAQWSKDPSTKVGAIVVADRRILGTGYNGFPPGVTDTSDRLNDRPTKYALVMHAERNAILNAMRGGHDITGAAIYVWPTLMLPSACNECMKEIVTARLEAIYMYDNANLSDRWQEQAEISNLLAREGAVTMYVLPEPKQCN